MPCSSRLHGADGAGRVQRTSRWPTLGGLDFAPPRPSASPASRFPAFQPVGARGVGASETCSNRGVRAFYGRRGKALTRGPAPPGRNSWKVKPSAGKARRLLEEEQLEKMRDEQLVTAH